LCRRLQFRHPSFQVTNKDVLCVALAGLLRKWVAVFSRTVGVNFFLSHFIHLSVDDIGHGPFSHLYEQFREDVQEELQRDPERRKLYEKFPEVPADWTHEQSSLMLVDAVLEELGVAIDMNHLDEPLQQIANITSAKSIRCYWDECDDGDDEKRNREILTSRDWIFIKECIFGGPIQEVVERFGKKERIGRLDPRLEWLYDIVSNRHNGIDVDKVDYFARDARHTLNEAGMLDISISRKMCIMMMTRCSYHTLSLVFRKH
jgi:HD superfamily phosphohydrolase